MEFEDDKLKKIIADSKLEMPFMDFEDNMMARIQRYEVKKTEAGKSQYFAMLTFLIGTVLGAVLNFLVSRNLDWISTSVDVQDKFYLVGQLAYVLLLVLFSDKLWKLIRFKKNHAKDSF